MKTIRYFEDQVLPRRTYIERSWCEAAVAEPVRRTTQPDGRIRLWTRITATPDSKPRYLRVVTLEDGETVHNALFDRDFREDTP